MEVDLVQMLNETKAAIAALRLMNVAVPDEALVIQHVLERAIRAEAALASLQAEPRETRTLLPPG